MLRKLAPFAFGFERGRPGGLLAAPVTDEEFEFLVAVLVDRYNRGGLELAQVQAEFAALQRARLGLS